MSTNLLTTVSWAFLLLSLISAVIVLIDILSGRPQKMPIMRWVWPITAVWSGPVGLWAYFRFGRMKAKPGSQPKKPFWQTVVIGDLHCAAGCTLGDVTGESLVFLTGFLVAGSVL